MRTQSPSRTIVPTKKELLEKLARSNPHALLGVLAYWVGDTKTTDKR